MGAPVAFCTDKEVTVQPWALVSIDGGKWVQMSIDLGLPPGSYKVRLTHSELGVTQEVSVRVASGKTQTLKRDAGPAPRQPSRIDGTRTTPHSLKTSDSLRLTHVE